MWSMCLAVPWLYPGGETPEMVGYSKGILVMLFWFERTNPLPQN